MKQLIYKIYALLFNISAKLFGIKENRVAFVSMHNENFNDSLGAIHKELEKSGKYEFVFISRQDLEIKVKNIFRVLSFFLVKSRKLATAKYVFLNDNFLPMANMSFKKDAVITQLWHGEGVFKKFGFAIEQKDEVRKNEIEANKRLSFVVCSSKNVLPFYAEAFGMNPERVLPLGTPRTDYLFEKGNEQKATERIEKLYPETRGKRKILYAPTFRDENSSDSEIFSHFDVNLFNEKFGEQYSLLVRFHPQVHTGEKITGAVDVTAFDDVRQLALACDVLITDYSSICMEFSLLDKKTVFFAYDLENYKGMRDFYFDYESYVPGKIAKTTEEIIKAIEEPFDKERNEKFKKFNFDFFEGGNAKRVVESIME